MLGLAFTTLLTACGSSSNQELEGTWRTVTFFIDENQEINYLGSEITFTTTQLTHEDHVASWEISEDENFLLIDSGHFFGSQRFELTGDTLELVGTTFFRVGSSAYDEERERVEGEANTLLGYLEELGTTRDEFDSAMLDAESRIEQEILTWLDGTWVYEETLDSLDGEPEIITAELNFNQDQFTFSIEFDDVDWWGWHEQEYSETEPIRITINLQTGVNLSQINAIQQSTLPQIDDITDAIEELRAAIIVLENLSGDDITEDSPHSWNILLDFHSGKQINILNRINDEFLIVILGATNDFGAPVIRLER